MTVLQDFKKFAMRGNIVDLATGVILGAAFGKIVTSLVENILMPPLGYIMSGLNFSELAITLKAATESRPAVVIGYGKFLQSSLDFIIVAFCIFLLLKFITKLQKTEPAPPVPKPAEPTREEVLLAEIRDLLARKAI
ncbi:MAG: large-conductance mechanosensitive channel protein MscL [Bdellovibrionota bacterium]|nr:MAG: large-conductance mechanosensitive channel protein MscL [Pseudomonadota bacterium]